METRKYDLSKGEKRAQWICAKIVIINVVQLHLMSLLLISPKGMSQCAERARSKILIVIETFKSENLKKVVSVQLVNQS